MDITGAKMEDKPHPKQQAHVVTTTVGASPSPLTTGVNVDLFHEALKEKLGAGCTDFNAVVEGALQQAGRMGVANAVMPLSPAASPAFHFRHCHDMWDFEATAQPEALRDWHTTNPLLKGDCSSVESVVWCSNIQF